MSKAILDGFINSVLTDTKRRYDVEVRKYLGRNKPHLITIKLKDVKKTIKTNFVIALKSTGKEPLPGDMKKLDKLSRKIFDAYPAAYNATSRISGSKDLQAKIYRNNTIKIYQNRYNSRVKRVFLDLALEILTKEFVEFSIEQQNKFKQSTQFVHTGASDVSSQTVGTEQLRILGNVSRGVPISEGVEGANTVAGLTDFVTEKELESAVAKAVKDAVEEMEFSTPQAVEKGKNAVLSMVEEIKWVWTKVEKNKPNIYKGEIVVQGSIGSSGYNRPGAESYDWKNIRPRIEELLQKQFSKRVAEYVSIQGSQSIMERVLYGVADTIEKEVKKNSKAKNIKVTGKIPKQAKGKTTQGKKEGRSSRKLSTDKSTLKIGAVAVGSKGTSATKKGEPRRSSLLKLQTLLNTKLPAQVRRNMGLPALVNRTGRFSNSVKVQAITTNQRGTPNIDYTYQKYPYQTFEPGYLQGTRARDPRRLIERSIRDIAAELLKQRFNVRRV